MDFKNLKSFIYVAELKSFTKASEKLGYSQSTVSFQIRQLEESLGIILFERVNHTIKLTPKGNEILKLAHKMMAVSDEMERVAREKKTPKGYVRIAMADSLCHWLFWDNFESFHLKFPEISLKIISARTEDMFRLAKQNEVDLIYTLDRHIYDQNYVIAYEQQVQANFIASVQSSLPAAAPVSMETLIREPLILTEKGMSYRRMLEEYLASRSMAVKPFLEIGDTTLICRLVEKNMGISYLPDYATQSLVDRGTVCRINVPEFKSDIWIQVLYHSAKRCTEEMQCVIDYLGERIEKEVAYGRENCIL